MLCDIRPWRPEDAPQLAAALNHRAIQDNLRDGLPFPYTEADAAAYIAAMREADPQETFAFAITVADRVVGSVGLFRQKNIHRQTAELGYYLAQSHWGQGLGTCAVGQACRYVFEHTDILRIFAEPFAHNAASRRLLEKCGFTLEGILRSNAVKNGAVIDMAMYALVKA